jgi:hypothetical protein
MTRFKRRMLIGLCTILLLLTGFEALAYKNSISPQQATPCNGLKLSCSAVCIARPNLEGEYRFFFITNRALERMDGPMELVNEL